MWWLGFLGCSDERGVEGREGSRRLRLAGCEGWKEAVARDHVGLADAGKEHSWVLSRAILTVNGTEPPLPHAG